MSKTKLTPEQKAYLSSIESKKKRKKIKNRFKVNNAIEKVFDMSFEIFTIADGTNLRQTILPKENVILTKEKLKEITEPKTSDSDFKKKFSLVDLRNAFTMARLIKKQDNSYADTEYHYNNFNDFLKDL